MLLIDGVKSHDILAQIKREGVVEVGCGSGAAILSLTETDGVDGINIGIDRNFQATLQTLENAKTNEQSISVVAGDLLTPFRKGGLPRTILFNPPYLPEDPKQDIFLKETERLALVGGKRGDETAWKLIREIENHQEVFVIFSTIATSLSKIMQKAENLNLEACLVKELPLGLETLLLVKFKSLKE